MPYLSSFLQILLDCLFPAFCLCCRQEGSCLCVGCISHMMKNLSPRKERLDGPLREIVSASEYREGELLPRLIHSLKYENIRDLARPLGAVLTHVLMEQSLPAGTILVPVPLHPSRQKSRGYNQTALISRHVSRALNIPAAELLKRTHFHKPQMELSREERLKNVRGAFTLDQRVISDFNRSLSADLTSIHVILVDDVATTLATLTECASALQIAGFRNISALSLARVS